MIPPGFIDHSLFASALFAAPPKTSLSSKCTVISKGATEATIMIFWFIFYDKATVTFVLLSNVDIFD